MTLEELANKEDELASATFELYTNPKSSEQIDFLQTVFHEYKQVHSKYTELASSSDEALKRALFIQWYALTEPSYLTGINEIDFNAEKQVIDIIETKLHTNSLDYELTWMLKYYAAWDFVFSRFKGHNALITFIANRGSDILPDSIDKIKMAQRGQMGKYWLSLNSFTEAYS